jgi:hypothetical protein
MGRVRTRLHGDDCSHQLIHDDHTNCLWKAHPVLVRLLVSGQELLYLAMMCFHTAWKISNEHRQADSMTSQRVNQCARSTA